MAYRRYEITLPTRYNDGHPIEADKLMNTRREIAGRFGALTFLPHPAHGQWTAGKTHHEDVTRVITDVEDTPENEKFFAQLKETLKERFQQSEIWIVSYEIRLV